MHSEAWGDPREHRGGHRMRMRTRGGPGPGPGAWAGGPFEFGMRGGPFGPPRFGGRGPRVRRGDVRAAILDLLAEGQPVERLPDHPGDRRAHPGRLAAERGVGGNPALQQLEDEALVRAEAGEDRRRMYTLTEEGRAYVEEHADELKASWDAVTGSLDDTEVQLRHTIHQVMVAVVAGGPGGLRGPGPAGRQDPG